MSNLANSRLLELKRQETEEAKVDGRKIGIEWAEQSAAPSQLWRLEHLVSGPDEGQEFQKMFDEGRRYGGPQNEIVVKINGIDDLDFDRATGDDFWDELGVRIEHYRPYLQEFLEAFADGAGSVWKQARLSS